MPAKENHKRILIVVSQINKAVSHEWVTEALRKWNYEVHFALLNARMSKMEDFLIEHQYSYARIEYINKCEIPRAILLLLKYMKVNRIEIVHAHLFEGGLTGMIAARLAGIRRRVYSRHHSTFHQKYFPGMVKYDRLINSLSSDLIAASKTVQELLINEEGVAFQKVHLVHHGFRFESFKLVNVRDVEALRHKYDLSGRPVIGSIARWVKWKGIQYTIEAFSKLLYDYPNATLVLANAHGDFGWELQQILSTLPESSYRLITFEENYEALYKLFNVFVHVPIDAQCEAYGQVYVEALAAGIPSVFTISGIASEFISNEENALVVPFENSSKIYEAVCRLLRDPSLAVKLISTGEQNVQHLFQFDEMIDRYDKIYQQ